MRRGDSLRWIQEYGIAGLSFLLAFLLACGGPAMGQREPPNGLAQNAERSSQMSDYDPIPLARMIGTTELAVIARVTAVRDDDLTLAVERRLRGTVGDQLIMAKFVPSKFDSPRAAPYTEGQQFVLFLTRPDAQVDRWRVRGLGGEGELPLENGYVYFHGRVVQGLERAEYRVHGVDRNIQRFPVEPVSAAVRAYARCFAWEQDDRRRWHSRQICNETTLRTYRRESRVHELITAESMQSAHQ